MRALFAVLFGYSVLVSVGFIVAVWPERSRDSAIFWFLASLAGVAAAVDGWLVAALLGAHLSPWWLATAVAVQDVVFTWRLWLALRSRVRRQPG